MSARRKAVIQQSRRKTVYKYLKNRHAGKVPCFVCHLDVAEADATLEHIKPQSRGGTDTFDNLTISHSWCNQSRGNNEW